jgi:hypothetical protein
MVWCWLWGETGTSKVLEHAAIVDLDEHALGVLVVEQAHEASVDWRAVALGHLGLACRSHPKKGGVSR